MAKRNTCTVRLNDPDGTKWKFTNPKDMRVQDAGEGIYVVETADGNTFTFPVRSVLFTSSVWEDVPDE